MKFTAACGPLIYRGDQFPAEYSQNAFVCEPEGNLIKRDILNFESLKTTAVRRGMIRNLLLQQMKVFVLLI